jgi:hypothetical protein
MQDSTGKARTLHNDLWFVRHLSPSSGSKWSTLIITPGSRSRLTGAGMGLSIDGIQAHEPAPGPALQDRHGSIGMSRAAALRGAAGTTAAYTTW